MEMLGRAEHGTVAQSRYDEAFEASAEIYGGKENVPPKLESDIESDGASADSHL